MCFVGFLFAVGKQRIRLCAINTSLHIRVYCTNVVKSLNVELEYLSSGS